jgi:peptidoglycan/xylan/chitin deacetylase (PgdA/CDA1 family)
MSEPALCAGQSDRADHADDPLRGERPTRADGVWWAASQFSVALRRAFGDRSGGRAGVVTYHRVAPVVPDLPAPAHNVTPRRFRAQLAGLLSRGYLVWPLRQVLAHREAGEPLPPKVFVVTFDDGYATTLHRALPVLRELGVPATVFVSTSFLDSDDPFPCDEWGLAHAESAPLASYRPLRRSECRELAASGLVELAAHTHTHQDFRGRPDDFRSDLQTNVAALRDEFGIERPTFAFPFGCPYRGFAADDLVAAAKRCGVVCGLTTEAALVDPQDDPFRWGRCNAFPWDTARTLAAKLGGWYAWMPHCWRHLRRRTSRAGGMRPLPVEAVQHA